MSTPPTPPAPGQPGEPEPRYGVRLPQPNGPAVPGQAGPAGPAQPGSERPGWDASPSGSLPPAPADPYPDGIPVQPSGIYTGYPNQPQVPGAAYGSPYGYGQPAPGIPGQVPERPSTARWASILLWIGSALFVVFSVIQLLALKPADLRELVLQSIPAEMHEQYMTLMTDDMIRSSISMAIVFIVIVAALAALVAWLTYRGSNAWRIVGTVCGVLAFLGNIGGSPFSWLFAALAAAIVVLWWLKPSNAWFRAVSAARRAGYPGR